MRILLAVLLGASLSGCAMHAMHHPGQGAAASAPATQNMILVRQTSKTPDQAVDAIKSYAEANKWVYLGANKVKQGEVTLVKVCIPAVGAVVWTVGLELGALLPCGNLAVYQKAGRTEISMLDPRYMSIVVSHPEVTRASAMAGPLLTQMLDHVAK